MTSSLDNQNITGSEVKSVGSNATVNNMLKGIDGNQVQIGSVRAVFNGTVTQNILYKETIEYISIPKKIIIKDSINNDHVEGIIKIGLNNTIKDSEINVKVNPLFKLIYKDDISHAPKALSNCHKIFNWIKKNDLFTINHFFVLDIWKFLKFVIGVFLNKDKYKFLQVTCPV